MIMLIRCQDGTCKDQEYYENDFKTLKNISPNPPSTPLKQLDPHTEQVGIVRTYAQVDEAIQDTPCYVSVRTSTACHTYN